MIQIESRHGYASAFFNKIMEFIGSYEAYIKQLDEPVNIFFQVILNFFAGGQLILIVLRPVSPRPEMACTQELNYAIIK